MSSSRAFLVAVAAVLAFAGAALLADFVLARSIARSGALEAGRLIRLAEGRDPHEIPIFGASKAEANYMPEALGPRFYNYGLASASPDVANFLIGLELQKPSRAPIVVDLFQGTFAEVGDPRNYLLLGNRPGTRELLERAGVWRWYYAVPGLRFYGSWDWYVKGLLTDRIALTKRVERGYVHHLDEAPWNAARFARDVEKRLKMPLDWKLDQRQSEDFLALARRAPERNFIVVLSPLHRSFLAHGRGEGQFRRDLAALIAAAPNLRLIDMTRAPYPDPYFLNTGHLNERGARAFSTDLRRELIRLGVIAPDEPVRYPVSPVPHAR